MHALALFLATGAGAGYSPFAPGTAGSLVAIPLVAGLMAISGGSTVGYVLLAVGVALVAIWAAGVVDVGGPDHDAGHIVIDEIAGMVVAGTVLPPGWPALAVAFVIFRVFDVIKPFPAGTIDRRVGGGLGVVGDDLIAGFYAGVATRLVFVLWGNA